jgi:hypothetical protein
VVTETFWAACAESDSDLSQMAQEQKDPAPRPGPSALLHADLRQSVKVAVNTVTPPWTTVMVALVKSMSVIWAVQLLFGQPA